MPHAPPPLVHELPHGVSPVAVFERLASLPHVVFLDSAMRDDQLGRYSFVAADPFRWWSVQVPSLAALAQVESAWAELAAHAAHLPELPPLQGGVVGTLAYEFGQAIEPHAPPAVNDLPMPALTAGLYDVVVAFDHRTERAWVISQGLPETDPGPRRRHAEARLAAVLERIESPPTLRSVPFGEPAPVRCSHDIGLNGVTSSFSPDAYLAAVARAIEHIHAGDVFQVNLAQRLLTPAAGDPVAMYLRLRERNPAPQAGYFDLGDRQIASASPESFLRVDGRAVETRPIKGTRARSGRPEADLFAGDDLRVSEKDRAENIMIVDLLRNDLSRTCTPESVHVAHLCRLEQYAFVQHLVSVVRGQLRPGRTPFDLLRTCFPGGSITGAPKPRAMQIIARLEPTARGPYCGTLFYVGLGGRMDSNILIRTITAGAGWWQMPVGGGIVAQSDPDEEYQETWHKARGMLEMVGGE